jgi:hypothetical protein
LLCNNRQICGKRLALKAKSETAGIMALKELLDREFGKAVQFLGSNRKSSLATLAWTIYERKIVVDFQRPSPRLLLAIEATQDRCR